jgi:Tfp pilus assembly protein PilV
VTARRSLSWTAALSDMRADRVPVEARRAIMAAQHTAKIEAMRARRGTAARLWTADGGFDHRAIMAAAVADARCIVNGVLAGGCWRKAMSRALTEVWNAARAAKRAGSH